MDDQQKQTILDLPKVIAVGIASPVVTFLTSRFGVAGTLIGLAVGAMILTVLVDFLKVYLARTPATVAKVPGTVVKMPGGLRTRLLWRHIHASARRHRALLTGSLLAAGISFLVGISIVTAVELGVGKSLSCWLWEDCPASESSSEEDGQTSTSTTLPSILGGGRSVPSGAAPAVQAPPASPQQPAPALPQQPTPSVPGVPSQPKGTQGSPEQQPSSAQQGQQGSPFVVPEEESQQSSSPGASQQAGKQPSASEEPKQRDQDQRNQPSSGSDQQPAPVPWIT